MTTAPNRFLAGSSGLYNPGAPIWCSGPSQAATASPKAFYLRHMNDFITETVGGDRQKDLS